MKNLEIYCTLYKEPLVPLKISIKRRKIIFLNTDDSTIVHTHIYIFFHKFINNACVYVNSVLIALSLQ